MHQRHVAFSGASTTTTSLDRLRRALTGRWFAAGQGFALGCALLALPLAQGLAPPSDASATRVDRAQAARAADRVADLVAEHRCWSGQAPADVGIPGHAVVTLPGGEPTLVDSQVGFDIWLSGRAGTLHAFCR